MEENNEEIEKDIERKKELIRSFLRVSEITGMDTKEKEKRLDAMLEDLYKLMKKRK